MTSLRRLALACLVWAASLSSAPGAEPIRLGFIVEATGANADSGEHQLRGAQLALDEINKAGGALGQPLELEIEDNQSTNPGSVRAFSKIVEKGNVAAVIGSIRSTQNLAMMPAVLKAGVPTLVGGTDYVLTHAGNPWIFRARPHDGYSSKVMASFGVQVLKRTRWAIVHSTETFGIGGKTRLIDALQALGVVPVTVQGIGNTDAQDLSLAIQAIRQADADIVAAYITSPADAAAFATQLRQQGVASTLMGTSSLLNARAFPQAGTALHGSYAVTDFAPEASDEAAAFAGKFRSRFGLDPNNRSSWTYDAVHLLAQAFRSAGTTQPAAVRKALLAIQGYKGAEGTYAYDPNGDGLHGYNVVKNEQGKIVFIKHVSFNR